MALADMLELIKNAQGKASRKLKKLQTKEGRDGRAPVLERTGHFGAMVYRDAGCAPLEYLESRAGESLLRDPPGWGPAFLAGDAVKRRARAARTYAEAKEGSQITPMASVDLGGAGGGGFGPRSPGDYKIDCMKTVIRLERRMPKDVARDMEDVFLHLKFIFDVPSKQAREIVMERIRLGLDLAALETGDLTIPDFMARWPRISVL
jgi:hypothetical protein